MSIPLTRSGCRSAYASDSVTPHDPPRSSHLLTPRCSRSCSMSRMTSFQRFQGGFHAVGQNRPQHFAAIERWKRQQVKDGQRHVDSQRPNQKELDRFGHRRQRGAIGKDVRILRYFEKN